MSEDREHCMAVGMDDFIAKPFHPEDLRRALERWAGMPPSTPGMAG
jgi:two-component system sensor histidine kinase/response regulator